MDLQYLCDCLKDICISSLFVDDCDDLVDSFDRGVFLDDSQRVSPCVKSTAQMKHLRALDIDSTEIYLDEIPGIGEKAADALEDLGIRTVCHENITSSVNIVCSSPPQ